jgi:small subunit ribosomal protein S1
MTDDSGDSFAALFEKAAATEGGTRRRKGGPRVGDRIEGTVVKVGTDSVFIELDGKQQAFLDASDFRTADGTMAVHEGDLVKGVVLEVDDREGYVRVGRSLGRASNVAELELAKMGDMPVLGKVTGVNKGGLEVEIGGVTAFCPMSQASAKFVEDPATLVGQTFSFLVSEIRDGGKGVVVSRRAAQQREAREAAGETMKRLGVGSIVRGTVTGVRDFGAFVDLGGVEGLIPRSEIAHDRGVQTSDALAAGDVVEVMVREIKEAAPAGTPAEGAQAGRREQHRAAPTHKITLSLKALKADPWDGLELPVGQVVEGTVSRVLDFGAFVKLPAGVEGLLHASELGGKGDVHKAWAPGQPVTVVVKSLDRKAKKLSLVPAPDGASVGMQVKEVALRVGAVVEGAVDRIETYGVFLQVDGTKGRAGRGLIPVAELGVQRGVDLRATFPKGARLTVKVLETGEGRLRFSVKAAKDAEERAQFEEARSKADKGASFGTLGDLLKKRK